MEDICSITPPAVLAHLVAKSEELGLDRVSEPRVGALLQLLAASKPGGKMLELGTGAGIGTAWLLSGMDAASTLTTVDRDLDVQSVAREALGDDSRVQFVTTEGAAFLFRQQTPCYDLVFADTFPGKFEVLEDALALIKTGGFYIVVDMLPQPTWSASKAERVPVLLDVLGNHPKLHVLPLAWANGVVVAVKKA